MNSLNAAIQVVLAALTVMVGGAVILLLAMGIRSLFKKLFIMLSIALVVQVGKHDKPIFSFQSSAADPVFHRHEAVGIVQHDPCEKKSRRAQKADDKINHPFSPFL